MFHTRMLDVSLTLSVHLDLCQNFSSVTEIKYRGRNGRALCLILFAGINTRFQKFFRLTLFPFSLVVLYYIDLFLFQQGTILHCFCINKSLDIPFTDFSRISFLTHTCIHVLNCILNLGNLSF